MCTEKLIGEIINGMSKEIQKVPDGFYDTYDFVGGDNGINHPWTWARLISVIDKINGVTSLVQNSKRFKPDIIVTNEGFKASPILYVDYESPNSCDRRIIKKDVKAYFKNKIPNIPYLVITSLPNKKSPEWKLEYTTYDNAANGHLSGKSKEEKKQIKEEIRENPFQYWYNDWKNELKDCKDKMNNIFYFANIASNEIKLENLFSDR